MNNPNRSQFDVIIRKETVADLQAITEVTVATPTRLKPTSAWEKLSIIKGSNLLWKNMSARSRSIRIYSKRSKLGTRYKNNCKSINSLLAKGYFLHLNLK
jgi:hypothetical protein